MVGHGGMSVGNTAYAALQLKLWRAGHTNVRVTTLECFPELEDTVIPWEWLDGKRPGRIQVHPLLLVAGDHAKLISSAMKMTVYNPCWKKQALKWYVI